MFGFTAHHTAIKWCNSGVSGPVFSVHLSHMITMELPALNEFCEQRVAVVYGSTYCTMVVYKRTGTGSLSKFVQYEMTAN
jgi:hypothetical protein